MITEKLIFFIASLIKNSHLSPSTWMSVIKKFCQALFLLFCFLTDTFRAIIMRPHWKVHSKKFLYNHSHAGKHGTEQCQYSCCFLCSSFPESFQTNTLLSCRIIIPGVRQKLITFGTIENFCLIQIPKWIKKKIMGKFLEKAARLFNFLIKKNRIPENVNEPRVPWVHFYTSCTILMPLLKKTEVFSLRTEHILFSMS